MMDFIHFHHFDSLPCALFLTSLFVIGGASPARLSQTRDPCSPNPCQNNALCRAYKDGYRCYCVPGYQGSNCHIEVDECVSQPCRNGASCVDGVGSFSCLCPPGFTGLMCEGQIDECQSQPCLGAGRCHGYPGGFACTCAPGFQGRRCEININECGERPCQNGAVCKDGLNGYSCDCAHTAFTGPHCETPLPPCHSLPCYNGATCRGSEGNYTCECSPGFDGRQCEIDVDGCSSGPCLNGGRCIQTRSWEEVHGGESLLLLPPEHDDQQGYICSCPPGTAGSLCQEVINQCESSPCQNQGRCESHVGGYRCHCLQQSRDGILYGGAHCDVRLTGCEGHECGNQGLCAPFLVDGTHGYTCSCSAGYTGPLCETHTSFSFERGGYLLHRSLLVDADVSSNITLSFRTVLPAALLFRRNNRGLLLSLELQEGRLRFTLGKEGSDGTVSPRQVLELPHQLSDGEWHSVEAVLENWALSLKVLGVCRSQPCHKAVSVQRIPAGPGLSPQTTSIGGVPPDLTGPAAPAFIGCMRDVFVDWQLVVPEEWLSTSAVNVSPGCSHRDRCLGAPCQHGGQCVNLWQSYQCRCPRPYEGQDCEEEHVTARFGHEDSHSRATFNVTDDLGSRLSVSLFIRTRRPVGLLLALVNSGGPYLHLWLEDGRVTVQLQDGESLRAESAVDDGDVHFVSVRVLGDRLTLYVANRQQGDVEIRPIDVRAGDTVYVGGLTESGATAAFGGYFKGCIQDLRINDSRLQFFRLDASVRTYPLDAMMGVASGCSGDDACARNPCLNGGICSSMWDDFSCSCPVSIAGRHCEEVRWCELSPCPAGSECRTLNQGYECYADTTFLNDSTVLSYRGNGQITRNLTNILLNLRTTKRNAAILHAEKGPAFITLSVQDGFFFMELQSTASDHSGEDRKQPVSTVSLRSHRRVSDGEWHSVQLFMAAPWARTSQWTLVLDEEIEEASTSTSRGGNLDFVRQGVDIFLGGLAPDAGWPLAGCVGTVELGGVALPYFSSSDVNLPRLQEEQFNLTSPRRPLPGCSGAPVCDPNPCLNGGRCQDLFNTYNCSCADGWAGRRCDVFVDSCASGPCVHGNCSAKAGAYECACEPGYAGVDCERQVDVCEYHRCAHGGTCLHGPDTYACLCPENYTGPLCNERIQEIPWYIVVRNVRPKLPVSVCGDGVRNYTCFNGGNCTERDLSCVCPPGFTGHRCEQEVDECKSNPCLNGGYCRNLVDRFVCVCEMSFAGEFCQTDLTSDLGPDLVLWVSVASAALLLLVVLTAAGLLTALSRRATHGAYSPSRQEKDGSRVEMWSITQPPPVERLI